MQLLQSDAALLVFAPFVLEPDADDARTQAGHLDELLFHERVGARVGRVAGPQRVQLLLVEDRSYSRRLLIARRLVTSTAVRGTSTAAVLVSAGTVVRRVVMVMVVAMTGNRRRRHDAAVTGAAVAVCRRAVAAACSTNTRAMTAHISET